MAAADVPKPADVVEVVVEEEEEAAIQFSLIGPACAYRIPLSLWAPRRRALRASNAAAVETAEAGGLVLLWPEEFRAWFAAAAVDTPAVPPATFAEAGAAVRRFRKGRGLLCPTVPPELELLRDELRRLAISKNWARWGSDVHALLAALLGGDRKTLAMIEKDLRRFGGDEAVAELLGSIAEALEAQLGPGIFRR